MAIEQGEGDEGGSIQYLKADRNEIVSKKKTEAAVRAVSRVITVMVHVVTTTFKVSFPIFL